MGMFNMVYIFNFCNLDLSCHGIPVAVYEGLEVMGTITDNCDIVGLRYTKIVSHIADKPKEYGISISFNDNS
jgi:centromeric protein E